MAQDTDDRILCTTRRLGQSSFSNPSIRARRHVEGANEPLDIEPPNGSPEQGFPEAMRETAASLDRGKKRSALRSIDISKRVSMTPHIVISCGTCDPPGGWSIFSSAGSGLGGFTLGHPVGPVAPRWWGVLTEKKVYSGTHLYALHIGKLTIWGVTFYPLHTKSTQRTWKRLLNF